MQSQFYILLQYRLLLRAKPLSTYGNQADMGNHGTPRGNGNLRVTSSLQYSLAK